MTTRKSRRETDTLTIISWLWMMPLPSLPELAAVTGLTYHRCNRLMKALYREGKVDSLPLGMTIERRDRWFLTTSGVEFAMRELEYSLEWQVTEMGLKLLIRRLPILETFYSLVHLLWGLEGVERIGPIYWSPDPDDDPIEFPPDLRLTRFQWQRGPDIHAITEYATEAWVPWVWVGPMTKLATVEEKRLRGLKEISGRSRFGDVPTPAGWVVVGADLLAAYTAEVVWRDQDPLVLTADGRTLRSMRPREFTAPRFEDARAEDPGWPESVPSWLEKDPALRVLNNKLNFCLFQFITQWPSATLGQLHRRYSHSRGLVTAALKAQTASGLVVKRDGATYLTRSGMQAAYRMDRISYHSIYSSLDVYLRPDGEHRRTEQPHDQAVIDFVLVCARNGIETGHGRRTVFVLPDRSQLAPDAVTVQLSPDGTVDWWFVEVELTAQARSAARRKLRHYRKWMQHFGWSIGLSMVVATDGAEEAFLTEGQGLRIRTVTLDRFLNSGPGVDPWREP